MENNIEILKLFTRKLANCKYRIPADKLTQYLKDGEFGYSVDEKNDKIITNDSVFADEVAKVIERIRAIFDEPHIALKQEEAILNASVAAETDNRSLFATIKDEKLWRVKLGNAKPEFVHSYVREDNLAIYENCFICFLVDYLFESITKKLSALCGALTTFNKKIDENGETVAYPQREYVGYTETVEQIPVLAEKSDAEITAICSLFKSKTILNSLKSFEIYKACKKVGFNIQSLKPTNILNTDKDYNYCYKFYLSYLQRKNLYLTQSQMYHQFALVNLMTAITDCGFKVAADSEDVLINESAELKVDNVNFENDLFRITLTKTDNDVVLDVVEIPDGSAAKYLFKFVVEEQKDALGKSVGDYAAELNETTEYTRVFVVSDELSSSENVVLVSAGDAKATANLREAIKSITLLAEGVEFIHSRYCPVCGTSLIAPEDDDFACTRCKSLYHLFRYENRDLIWIKRLPCKDEKKAKSDNPELHVIVVEQDLPEPAKEPEIQTPAPVKTETRVIIEDLAVAEAEPVETETLYKRKVIQKSFTGKMSQATKEQVAYYNEIKNYLLSFKRVNSRVSWHFDSFNIGRDQAAKISFRGKVMVMYLALDPKKYEDTKYFPHDFSDKKKYADTPMMIKIKSERGVKFAKELVDVICEGLTPKKDFVPETYKFTRMSDKKLVEVGLAKITYMLSRLPMTTAAKPKPAKRAANEEIAVAKAAEPASTATRKVVQKSFTGKMSQASKEQVAYYNEIKNYLLSFKRVNSRVSWNFDSFNIGRDQAAKIAFRGKVMVMYLALDPKKYEDTKYFPRDFSDKQKFADTPMMIKIKSERGVKFAKELVDVICEGLTPKKDFVPETYKFTRMSDKRLIENGLAKETVVKL